VSGFRVVKSFWAIGKGGLGSEYGLRLRSPVPKILLGKIRDTNLDMAMGSRIWQRMIDFEAGFWIPSCGMRDFYEAKTTAHRIH